MEPLHALNAGRYFMHVTVALDAASLMCVINATGKKKRGDSTATNILTNRWSTHALHQQHCSFTRYILFNIHSCMSVIV